MRIVGLALAGVFASTIPMTGYAAGPGSNILLTYQEPSSNIVLVWDGGGPGGQAGAIGSRLSAGRGPQWNGRRGFAHWGPNRHYGGWGFYGGPPAPTYWVWVPGSAVFDYPFADWRGPHGGWGNP
jgi:hypothetical protein